jgi:mono/diheme cytochrome c family protein
MIEAAGATRRGVQRDAVAAAACALATLVWCAPAPASAQAQHFTARQVETGAEIYQRNCSPCHGPHMQDPQSAFNLRDFPADQRDRFVTSVTRGKNQMPPWGDMLKPDDIEALWAYVVDGER